MCLELNSQSRDINMNNFIGKDVDATKMKAASLWQLGFLKKIKNKLF